MRVAVEGLHSAISSPFFFFLLLIFHTTDAAKWKEEESEMKEGDRMLLKAVPSPCVESISKYSKGFVMFSWPLFFFPDCTS